MPDIIIKNRQGQTVTFTNVPKITCQTPSGEEIDFGLDSISALTDFSYLHKGNARNELVGTYGTARGTNFSYMFESNELRTIPLFDTSKGTKFGHMFSSCKYTHSFPTFDTSKGTNFDSMFSNCMAMETVPALNTGLGTTFEHMFTNCYEIESVPLLNTGNGTNFYNMFYGCKKLKTVPAFDLSKATRTSGMFYGCEVLELVPVLDTSKVTDFGNMFQNCYALITISGIDVQSVSGSSINIFNSCRALQNLTILNIKKNIILAGIAASKPYGNLLTVASLLKCSQECIKQTASRTMTIKEDNLAKLANVYVRFTNPSQTSIAVGEKGEVEQCESTDTGAMLISEYMALKSWVYA